MKTIQPLVTEFALEGRLEDWVISGDRLKRLYLTVGTTVYDIKVAKGSASAMLQEMRPGCWLKVSGMRKHQLHRGETKYKAYRIELLTQRKTLAEQPKTKKSVKLLICNGSSCRKKGAGAICALVQKELSLETISPPVEITITGCLHHCEDAPNVMQLPERVHYRRVLPEVARNLIISLKEIEN